MSIWDKMKERKAPAKAVKEKVSKLESMPEEMRAEIKAMRDKNKQFNATNEIGSYAVIVFSCEADRKKFVQSLKIKKSAGDVFLDGYEVARFMKVQPEKPSLKLPPPLDVTRMRND